MITCIGIYLNGTFEAPELKIGVWKDLDHLSVCLNDNGQAYFDKNRGGDSDILHPDEEIQLQGNVFVCAFTSREDRLEWFRNKPGWTEGMLPEVTREDDIPLNTFHAALKMASLSSHAV